MIKLHTCPCKVHHVDECYKQLHNFAKGHINTALSQENQNDPLMPLTMSLQIFGTLEINTRDKHLRLNDVHKIFDD